MSVDDFFDVLSCRLLDCMQHQKVSSSQDAVFKAYIRAGPREDREALTLYHIVRQEIFFLYFNNIIFLMQTGIATSSREYIPEEARSPLCTQSSCLNRYPCTWSLSPHFIFHVRFWALSGLLPVQNMPNTFIIPSPFMAPQVHFGVCQA